MKLVILGHFLRLAHFSLKNGLKFTNFTKMTGTINPLQFDGFDIFQY